MEIILYWLAVLALDAGLVVFSYLDRIYRELGRVSTGRVHANLDIFEAEIEPRIRMDRRRAGITFSLLSNLWLVLVAVLTARGVNILLLSDWEVLLQLLVLLTLEVVLGVHIIPYVLLARSSGRWLFRTLHRQGFASQATSEHRGDALRVRTAYITAVVRCAPPGNRPTGAELANCAEYLRRELALLPRVRVIVALGQIAFTQVLVLVAESGVALPRPRPRFVHGASYLLPGRHGPIELIASYHPSRQNTQTGRLTEAMLDAVFTRARLSLTRAS